MYKKLICVLTLFASSFVLADARDYHAGWAHDYECTGSKDSDCIPHCHDVDDETVDQVVEERVRELTKTYADLLGKPHNPETFSRDYLALIEIHKEFFKKYRKSALSLLRGDTNHTILTIYDKSECDLLKSSPNWPPHPSDYLFLGSPKKEKDSI